MSAAYKQPFSASACSFHEIPHVEAIDYGFDAERTTVIADWFSLLNMAESSLVCGGTNDVWSVGERPPVKDSEEGHFYAEKHRGNADLDIRSLNRVVGFDCAGASKEGDDDRLPETQEDNKFDGQNFQNRFVLSYVAPDLVVELDYAVHSYCDCDTFNDHDPDVGESWIKRFETISFEVLGDNRCDSHRDTDEAVLEDRDPDDIEPSQTTSGSTQPAIFSSSAFLEIFHRPDPWLWFDTSEILFLIV